MGSDSCYYLKPTWNKDSYTNSQRSYWNNKVLIFMLILSRNTGRTKYVRVHYKSLTYLLFVYRDPGKRRREKRPHLAQSTKNIRLREMTYFNSCVDDLRKKGVSIEEILQIVAGNYGLDFVQLS